MVVEDTVVDTTKNMRKRRKESLKVERSRTYNLPNIIHFPRSSKYLPPLSPIHVCVCVCVCLSQIDSPFYQHFLACIAGVGARGAGRGFLHIMSSLVSLGVSFFANGRIINTNPSLHVSAA